MMLDCPHRSKEFRLVACPSCNGDVQVKVFKCAKSGECSISKRIDGIPVCDERPALPIAVTRTTAPRPPQTVNVDTSTQRLVATMLFAIKPETPIVVVQLDDGTVISAANARRLKGHKNKRCVVGKTNEEWILLQ